METGEQEEVSIRCICLIYVAEKSSIGGTNMVKERMLLRRSNRTSNWPNSSIKRMGTKTP